MVKSALAIALAAGLAGCASIKVELPLNGRLGGEFASGFATLRGDETASFYVQNRPGGLRCEGAYAGASGKTERTEPVACNDGRTGTVTLKRKDVMSLDGIALVTLSDGSRGQFVFGKNTRYEEEFPGPDTTAPPARPARRR